MASSNSNLKHLILGGYRSGIRAWIGSHGSLAFHIALFLVLVAYVCGVAIIAPHFISPSNLLNVLRQSAVMLVAAVGMTLVITLGAIDLSVGATLAVVSVFIASALQNGYGLTCTIAAAVILGAVLGSMNGFFVAYPGISPLIVTLAFLMIQRGAISALTRGNAIPIAPGDQFLNMFRAQVLPVPVPVMIALVIVILGVLLLNRTRFGLHVIAIGNDQEAARRAGINIRRTKLLVFTLNGFIVSIAAILSTARQGSGSPNAALGFELMVIASVILGGTSIAGGDGRMIGTGLAVLLLAVVDSGLVFLHVSEFYQQSAKGLGILIAVLFNQVILKRQEETFAYQANSSE